MHFPNLYLMRLIVYIEKRTTVTLTAPLRLEGYVIPCSQYQVRALLLLGTADLKTHQGIALYAGGKP